MLHARQNKIDSSKLSEEEKKLFRLPTGKDILNHKLKERKYFDAEDFSLSKAGNSDFSKDYQLLQKKCSELNSENYSLQTTNDNLQKKSDDLQRQIREKDKLINAGAITLQTTQSQLTTSQNQNRQKDTQITQLNNDLTTTRNEIGQLNTQIVTKDNQITQITNEKNTANEQLTLTRGQLEELTTLFNNLQVANTEKDREIEKQSKKIKKLKELLGKSQEEILNRKIDTKEERLEKFVQQFKINLEQIKKLCNVYEDLIIARKNFNRDNIRNADNNIDEIKQEILSEITVVEDRRKICRKCEKLANLKLELEQLYQQQYQARQEVPRYD